MANDENLKPVRSKSEARERGRMGGKASGKSRRQKADFRRTLNALLTSEIDNPEWTPILQAMGLDSTLESAVNMAMIKQAMLGDVKAYDAIAKYSGQISQTDADLTEQAIRIDRANRARDQETGSSDNSDGIRSFLSAMKPTAEDLESLFADQNEEEADHAEKAEETGDI